jgi:glutaredoxin
MATLATDAPNAPAPDVPDAPGTRRRAVIHRMMLPDHLCPSGLKALDLLKRHGFEVEDHPLRTRAEVEAFKAAHGVRTTPQVWIDGEHVGGYDATRAHLGRPLADPKALTYKPVLAIFGVALALAAAFSWAALGTLAPGRILWWFLGIATTLLALQKLRDVEGFSTSFLNYDLLARRWVRYAYAYPWLEAGVGVLMVAGAAPWLSIPVALLIGTVGAASVFKAVYIDRRELKCACVGGNSNVPLGFVSLSENLAMIAMALWMLLATLGAAPMAM